jgi:uncharacterized protein CbrC (UPF0167 family)
MSQQLPAFRYHPDPLGTGSVVVSSSACPCCARNRGYAYAGPIYAVEELEDLCPWCIAAGAAAKMFDARFTDAGWDAPDDVPAEVLNEIEQRTPGFPGWQQERWMYHCRDGMAFIGLVDGAAPRPAGVAPNRWQVPARSGADHGTTYLFRCLHCPAESAYHDCT